MKKPPKETAANSAMVTLYWDIGRLILERQAQEGWGARVIDRLAADLCEAHPDMSGLGVVHRLCQTIVMKVGAKYFSPAPVLPTDSYEPGWFSTLTAHMGRGLDALWCGRSPGWCGRKIFRPYGVGPGEGMNLVDYLPQPYHAPRFGGLAQTMNKAHDALLP